ncbi:MAG: polyphosphate kinase 1 [Gammaproteobacteria bacterium]|nr:polyphosphate kinase 1 [Gammaproteobacteria bacterium]
MNSHKKNISVYPDLDDPSLYLNRELTWLEFNRRVLFEAIDQENPLLERLKFIAIFASNMDEFFMKRIGGLKLQVAADMSELTDDGRTPLQQMQECKKLVEELTEFQETAFVSISNALREHKIAIINYQDLQKVGQNRLRQHYLENVFPLMTPQIFDPAHPFPFISNLSLNLVVTFPAESSDENAIARVKVPIGPGVPRFIKVDDYRYVPLEQIIANNLDLLFPGESEFEYDFFFVARNASTERQESGAADLLSMIELELRDRRIAPIVRMVVNKGMNPERQNMLTELLGLDSDLDVYETNGLLARRDLFELTGLPILNLRYPPHQPINHYRLQDSQRSIFNIIREEEAILLQHPYESFSGSVVRFLGEAARDESVRAIKMTLYRTDRETRIVDLLIEAANNGKQVAVVVEIKAKFDEANNITWAERLEEAGIHVTYGVVGFKTHSKVLLVIRREKKQLQRYVHIGTGNYHGGTAKLYTDLGLLTCNKEIGEDATELFNFLTTGHIKKRQFKHIVIAPIDLKTELRHRIATEIKHVENGKTGLIRIKTNALEDKDVVKDLYKASIAGVKVELIVRDTCRLRPKVANLSENITVISVVGRFLEHSRIFYFHNNGKHEYFIGSADIMKRNLESRVEVVTPIVKESLKESLKLILDTLINDHVDSWEMCPDGSYISRKNGDLAAIGCQLQLLEYSQARTQGKRGRKKKRLQSIRKRN